MWGSDDHQLPPAVQQELVSACKVRAARDGFELFRQGETTDSCFCVVSGLVELTSSTEDGEVVVADLLGSDEWFGFSHFLAARRSSFAATTVGPTKLLELGRLELERLHSSYPAVQQWLRGLAIDQAERMANRITVMTLRSVEARLDWLLDRHGEQVWAARLSQRQIARLVGSTRQRVNEAFARRREAA